MNPFKAMKVITDNFTEEQIQRMVRLALTLDDRLLDFETRLHNVELSLQMDGIKPGETRHFAGGVQVHMCTGGECPCHGG
jgi:hypothetical protein